MTKPDILEEQNCTSRFQEDLRAMEAWEACARRGLTLGKKQGRRTFGGVGEVGEVTLRDRSSNWLCRANRAQSKMMWGVSLLLSPHSQMASKWGTDFEEAGRVIGIRRVAGRGA